MPRLTRPVPSYRLHKPSARAVVTLNGKDHYLGPWNSPESHAQYDRLISEWLAARKAPVHSTPAGRFTLAQLLLAYLKEAQVMDVKNGKETSHLHNIQQLRGMRPGEVVILRGCDLDTTGTIWVYKPAFHKTEHLGFDRPVYLGPRAQKTVEQYLRPEMSEYLFNPREAVYPRQEKGLDLEQVTEKCKIQQRRKRKTASCRRRGRRPGTRYTSESYRRAIARACSAAKIPQWHPNQLRHNAATALRKEFGIEAARVVLGHRASAVTEVNAELDRGRAAEIMARVG